jgi:predicted patatin/cPLA2 family phospholipase
MTDIPTYHVLALSGGGYRGLYTATRVMPRCVLPMA